MSRSARLLCLGLPVAAVLLGIARPPTDAPKDSPRYGRDIRPILSDRCFQCHGPDAGKRQAKLRLDLPEEATAARKHGAPIVPFKPDESEVWRRINSTDPEVHMPPPTSTKPPLNDEQKELVRQWIAAGAKFEPHWAFVPPTRPPVPAARQVARNPIDAFLLSRLEKDGIDPSPAADKTTQLRRLFLDLTGLPPTPEETDSFLADARPDAYEQWVDKLLTSEPYRTRYAERMAVPWMDQARYADTCGIHMDAGRQMWLYRDYVLKAYRDNKPFDQFIREQIAGDLMPDATEDQKIASGFNRCHVTTDEGGAIAEEYLVEYAVDRTATTGSVFLGLTVGCARCHDHKFDPVTNEEFYKLYAYFDSIEEPGLYSQTTNPNRAHEPFISVPTAKQKEDLARIAEASAALKKQQEQRTPDEDQRYAEFVTDLTKRSGLLWVSSEVTAATSVSGQPLEPQPDGSVRGGGENPKRDTHHITLRTDATNLRLIQLEALPEPTAPEGRIGRAFNGNAVLSGITAEAVSIADPTQRRTLDLFWAWADFNQQNGDHNVTNALDAGPEHGWALGGHERPSGRIALFASRESFGFEGGTELHIDLKYESQYDYHILARVRLSLGSVSDAGLALLPLSSSRWYITGPFPPDANDKLYEASYGPETTDGIDLKRNFGFGNQMWRWEPKLVDDSPVSLADGRNVVYVGRTIYSPTRRPVELSLGSDDGFQLYLNGEEIASRQIDRAVAPDQDRVPIYLRPGRNTLVLKIVNTAGKGGYYYHANDPAELSGDLAAAYLKPQARTPELNGRLSVAWRTAFLPAYREAAARLTALDKETADINAAVPLTMVMKELPEPRPTFILTRGQYDHPDQTRPVTRGIPAALGKLPEGAPANRLGLAEWLTSPDNPLVSRVIVNRFWEQCFGTGLVRTTEDFGLQGEWPSHPELLDWLAVEFRESGWDVRHMIRLIVTSDAYRRSSYVRPELKDHDPDDRLLAFFPRRRLSAEQTRDQALYVSGLLVEKLGGPSVKPYQPDGLWQEVAMPQSNTREYKVGIGDELWRRSLYTYWKRASPPPAMLTFDAPTREFCTIRRTATSTPLQALVLWNDEQFVEAARVLAQRTLAEPGDDAARLTRLFRRCAARTPNDMELAALTRALAAFRERYAAAPDDAKALIKTGMAPASESLDPAELAAWTMIASATLNLYETTTQE
jgi:hypothetical protein